MYVDWKGARERFAALEERVRASGSKIALGHYLSNSGLAGLADGSVAKFREAMALDLEQGWVATYNLAVLHVGQEQYDEGWSLADALEAEVADDPMEEENRMFVALLRGQVLTLRLRAPGDVCRGVLGEDHRALVTVPRATISAARPRVRAQWPM